MTPVSTKAEREQLMDLLFKVRRAVEEKTAGDEFTGTRYTIYKNNSTVGSVGLEDCRYAAGVTAHWRVYDEGL